MKLKKLSIHQLRCIISNKKTLITKLLHENKFQQVICFTKKLDYVFRILSQKVIAEAKLEVERLAAEKKKEKEEARIASYVRPNHYPLARDGQALNIIAGILPVRNIVRQAGIQQSTSSISRVFNDKFYIREIREFLCGRPWRDELKRAKKVPVVYPWAFKNGEPWEDIVNSTNSDSKLHFCEVAPFYNTRKWDAPTHCVDKSEINHVAEIRTSDVDGRRGTEGYCKLLPMGPCRVDVLHNCEVTTYLRAGKDDGKNDKDNTIHYHYRCEQFHGWLVKQKEHIDQKMFEKILLLAISQEFMKADFKHLLSIFPKDRSSRTSDIFPYNYFLRDMSSVYPESELESLQRLRGAISQLFRTAMTWSMHTRFFQTVEPQLDHRISPNTSFSKPDLKFPLELLKLLLAKMEECFSAEILCSPDNGPQTFFGVSQRHSLNDLMEIVLKSQSNKKKWDEFKLRQNSDFLHLIHVPEKDIFELFRVCIHSYMSFQLPDLTVIESILLLGKYQPMVKKNDVYVRDKSSLWRLRLKTIPKVMRDILVKFSVVKRRNREKLYDETRRSERTLDGKLILSISIKTLVSMIVNFKKGGSCSISKKEFEEINDLMTVKIKYYDGRVHNNIVHGLCYLFKVAAGKNTSWTNGIKTALVTYKNEENDSRVDPLLSFLFD